ncbi:MAG: hypothetical protein RSF40_11130 [Oscillospiraceae bacterium]
MESIKKQAINGYNETVQTIKAAQKKHHETQKHFVTLVVFDSSEIKAVYDRVPCEKTEELNDKTYQPNACTPLYDAMGMALNKFRYSLDENADNKVLVTVITDGEENSSQEYSGEMIKKLVDELKAKGWVFAYIGANQDVEKVAATISITNVINFEATDQGTQVMFAKDNKSRMGWFDRVAKNESAESLQENFFKEEE